jgi:hypothetical protein
MSEQTEAAVCPDCGHTLKLQDAQKRYSDEWRFVCYKCCWQSAICSSYPELLEALSTIRGKQ